MRPLICATFLLTLTFGCSQPGSMVQVTGTLKNADGSPLVFEVGTVVFQATEGATHASGSVQRDGSFTMMTKKPGDGVKPGHYKVALQLWKSYSSVIPAVSKKYMDAATSPLEATVDPSHTHFDFLIKE
jgi:hypothetical protein